RASTATYGKDVAPILQRHCQECHRPGGDAPFALTGFEDVRSRARMIAEVVSQQRMPPWLASARHGEFANRRGLDPVERRTIADWVPARSARGHAAAEPPPLRFPESRWKIGEPDLVIRTAVPDRIPATGQVPYEYTVLPHLFAEDTWLQAIQILPDNPRVVHHVNLGYLNL